MKSKLLLLLPLAITSLACGGGGGLFSNNDDKATTVVVKGGPGVTTSLDVWAIPGDSVVFADGTRLHKDVTKNQVKPEVQMPYQEGRVTYVVTELDKRTVLARAAVNVVKGFRITVTTNQEPLTGGGIRTTLAIVGEQR